MKRKIENKGRTPKKRMLVFDGKCANIPQAKVRAPRANNTLMVARVSYQSYKTPNKDLYGKMWPCAKCLGSGKQLQVKLAKMAVYIEKRFTTSATPTPAIPAQYPPAEEGMV